MPKVQCAELRLYLASVCCMCIVKSVRCDVCDVCTIITVQCCAWIVRTATAMVRLWPPRQPWQTHCAARINCCLGTPCRGTHVQPGTESLKLDTKPATTFARQDHVWPWMCVDFPIADL